MNKEERLKLKLEIYKNVYDAIAFNNPAYIGAEIEKLEAQLELLEEMRGTEKELCKNKIF